MPSDIIIAEHKEKYINALYFVMKVCRRKNQSFGMRRFLLNLLSDSLSKLLKLATLCGMPLLTFVSAQSSQTANEPIEFKSSLPIDFDQDGDIDILDADNQSGDLYLLRNSGLNFTKELLHNPNFDADLVGLADLDQDGDQDIVIIDQATGAVQIIDNQGSQNFVPLNASSLDSEVNQAFLSDLNNDGSQEIVFSTPTAVGWAKNNGTEGFVPQSQIAQGLSGISSLEVGDLDADGNDDIYYTSPNSSLVGFATSQGTEGFSVQNINSNISGISDIEIADLDADGKNDLVYSSDSSSLIGWMKNNGSDGFVPATTIASGMTAVDQIEIADLDNDSDLDIVGASSSYDFRAWIENKGSEGFVPHQLG